MVRERAGRFELLADLVGIHLVPTVQVSASTLVPASVVPPREPSPRRRGREWVTAAC